MQHGVELEPSRGVIADVGVLMWRAGDLRRLLVVALAVIAGAVGALAVGQDGGGFPDTFVIATAEPIPKDRFETLSKATVEDAVKKLEGESYVRFSAGGKLYLIDPKLAQQERIEKMSGFWRAVLAAKDGVVAGDIEPGLSTFVKDFFGGLCGAVSAEKSSYAMEPVARVVLQSGSQSVSLSFSQPYNPGVREQLNKNPLLIPKAKPGDPPRRSPGYLNGVSPRSIHLQYLGKQRTGGLVWAQDFEEVSKHLAKMQLEMQTLSVKALEHLGARAKDTSTSEFLAALDKGMNLAQVTKQAQDAIRSKLMGNFSSYGFKSAEDAEAFLSSAKIGSARMGVNVLASRGNGGFEAIAIYP
ncbi:MAG: hypothetical protein KF784_06120 [Fimbriimonadaceae bacterium]|nr:hypothetical protein [Fimbriimonadaceae bacterium]